MATLFDIAPELPEGFYYFPGFITEQEEQDLITLIKSYALKNMIFQGFEAKRKVASFGFDYHFDSKKLEKGKPIPTEFIPVIAKVAAHLNVEAGDIAEILLTEYGPGAVINWHRDAPPFDRIAGISLLSDCTFKLRPYDKLKQLRPAIKSFTVAHRSFYIMQGPARSEWEHSISPVKQTRYSITFRTLKDPIRLYPDEGPLK